LDEQAQFFENRRGEQLFGILHRPRVQKHSDLGIVFCHPISWEKQFSYRAYSQFSRHLADAGYTSFRFDAAGFGDSDGEFVDATVNSQVQDVIDALEWLRDAAGCKRFVLIGARLGAAIAALTAIETPAVEGLVLVSPVVSGEAYWKELLRFSRFGRMTLGQKLIRKSDLVKQLEDDGAAEIDGELFGHGFVEELRAIDLLSHQQAFEGSCLLSELKSGGSSRERYEAFADSLNQRGATVSASFDEPKEFWVATTRYAGYLPKNLYQRTVEWLGREAAL
jgi:pimeloyl-ACP methyl ester carboxylesterase